VLILCCDYSHPQTEMETAKCGLPL
jgi:hypothetical protein